VAAECPNEQFRTGLSANLPECRAYEMVSPPDKNNYNVRPQASHARVSLSGDAITFDSVGPFPGTGAVGTTIAPRYLATRGLDGWTTTSIDPPRDSTHIEATFGGFLGEHQDPAWFSADLTENLLLNYRGALTPDANSEELNLYVRRGSSLQLLAQAPPLLRPYIAGASANHEHVIFESRAELAPGATGFEPKLYESSNGTVSLVGILPGGTPAESSVAGAMQAGFNLAPNAISEDGSRVFFTDHPAVAEEFGPQGQLYLREDNGTPAAITVRINASERTAPEPSPAPAFFREATPDGSKVYFTTAEPLVDEDTNSGVDLYRYDVSAEAGHHLTLISPDTSGEEASVAGLLGSSSDGEVAYFAVNGRLRSQDPSQPGSFLLYQWDHGVIRYIATLGGSSGSQTPDASVEAVDDRKNWGIQENAGSPAHVARVSSDGRFLSFVSNGPVTPYNSHTYAEVYLYDAAVGNATCVSCPSSGAAPTGSAHLEGGFAPFVTADHYQVPTLRVSGGRATLYFESPEPLVAGDGNGKMDVYRYDSSSQAVSLISSGTGTRNTWFLDATPSGSDVMFATTAPISPWDTDELYDVYDARVGGGVPSPPSVTDCNGEACQAGGSETQTAESPGSELLTGAGNVRHRRHRRHKHHRRPHAHRGHHSRRHGAAPAGRAATHRTSHTSQTVKG
jgi:hypothetical protein